MWCHESQRERGFQGKREWSAALRALRIQGRCKQTHDLTMQAQSLVIWTIAVPKGWEEGEMGDGEVEPVTIEKLKHFKIYAGKGGKYKKMDLDQGFIFRLENTSSVYPQSSILSSLNIVLVNSS